MNLPDFPNVDLFSAGVNALNGVLVARNPSHSSPRLPPAPARGGERLLKKKGGS